MIVKFLLRISHSRKIVIKIGSHLVLYTCDAVNLLGCFKNGVFVQDAVGAAQICGRRVVGVELHLPPTAGARGGGGAVPVQPAQALFSAAPARPEPIAGVRREAGAAAATLFDSGAAGHWQNCHLGLHRLPPGQAERQLGARVRPLQHCRRPTHRENPPDRPQGGAAVCQVKGGHRLARLLPRSPQPD
jgi:hypothetical protein